MSNHTQVLTTKLHAARPRQPLVERPQLLDRFSEGIVRKLTLVCAPAGFGKTTLLGAWLQQAGQPVAWLSLETGDNDPARFWTYVVAALQTLHAGLGQNALALFQASGPQPPSMEAALTALINDLDRLPGDLVLMLDDYHLIDSESIHAALAYFVEHLPPQLHLVIGSRSDPPLPLARMRARGELSEIRAPDLRFSVEEAATFLNEVMALPLTVDDVATLAAHTEGWVSGLQLAALSLRTLAVGERHSFVTSFAGTQRDVADYLLEEVFSRQPESVQYFLLQTCFLDRLCGPLCDAVTGASSEATGVDGGQAMLERLEKAGLFIVPLDNRRHWYRYHHLFVGALRLRLHQIHPEWLPILHGRASAWFEQHATRAEAIDHALAGEDFQRAAWLLAQIAEATLWQSGEISTLLTWLAALPAEAKRPWPQLCLIEAWLCLWNSRLALVGPLLDYTEATSPTPAITGQAATIRAELARLQGDLPGAVDFAQRALEALPAESTPARAISLGILAGVYQQAGEMAAARRAYTEAHALMQAHGQVVPALIAAGSLIELWALQGEPRQAAEVYQQLMQQTAREPHVASLPAIGVAHVRMGEVLRWQNDLGEAQRLLSAGIALCLRWEGLADCALEGCLSLSDLHASLGDETAAAGFLEQAGELAQGPEVPPLLRDHLAARRARSLLRQGRLPDAVHWKETCGLQAGDEPALAQRSAYIVLARVLMAEREPTAASRLLERLLPLVETAGLAGDMIEVSLLLALILYGQGQVPKALVALVPALSLAERTGYVYAFVAEGPAAIALLNVIESRGGATPFVRELREMAGHAAPATLGAETGPVGLLEPLTAREEEVLRLTAAGLSVPEIAADLVIAPGTVRAHLKTIYRKLDIHNRVQAAAAAQRLGLL